MTNARNQKGFTIIEMITVVVIISILAAAALPIAETALRREQELELRRALREMRQAIDEFHKFVEENKIEADEDTYGFPTEMKQLVEGIEYRDKDNKRRIRKFLRKIPFNPITHDNEWGFRSYQDKPESRSWGGENIWDVYCDTYRKALDGTYYKDW